MSSLSGSSAQSGELNSLSHNFVGSVTADVSDFEQPGDMAGTASVPLDPDLGPLQLNGGTTLNRMPLVDSLVVGAGSPALDAQYNVTTDQTGFARTVNGTVDQGADERLTGLLGATLTVNSSDGTENPTTELTLAEAVALTNGAPELFPTEFAATGTSQQGDRLRNRHNSIRSLARGSDDQSVRGAGHVLRSGGAGHRRAGHDHRAEWRRDDQPGGVRDQPEAVRCRRAPGSSHWKT